MTIKEFPSWYCVNSTCDEVLGHIVVGEIHLADTIDPGTVESRGNGMIISCPKCGTKKVWYSSSPLVRSLEQFINVLSEIIAKRSLNIIHKDLREIGFGKGDDQDE